MEVLVPGRVSGKVETELNIHPAKGIQWLFSEKTQKEAVDLRSFS
jgi:hypothetical protein